MLLVVPCITASCSLFSIVPDLHVLILRDNFTMMSTKIGQCRHLCRYNCFRQFRFKPFASFSSSTAEESPLPLNPWKGGFKDSNPDFSPSAAKPDLSTIPMTKNLDNIDKITRMQKIKWPEFSWYSKIGDPSSRVYTTFAQDVSRIGYDDDGRIWSFVCPQRAMVLPLGIGCAFIEVTVTGVRGWVDEDNKSCYADVSVVGNLWLEGQDGNPLVEALRVLLKKLDPCKEFPFRKDRAVQVYAHQVGKPDTEEWPMVTGMDPNIFQPLSKRHFGEAYSVYNLEVEMGKRIKNKKSPLANLFDALLLSIFNKASGGILDEGQRVSWNVWPLPPEGVDTDEWQAHADLWYTSMKVKHEYPDGKSILDRDMTYADGTEFKEGSDSESILAEVREFFAGARKIVGEKRAAELENNPMVRFITRHFGVKTTDHIK